MVSPAMRIAAQRTTEPPAWWIRQGRMRRRSRDVRRMGADGGTASQASLATFTAVVDSMTRQTKAQAWRWRWLTCRRQRSPKRWTGCSSRHGAGEPAGARAGTGGDSAPGDPTHPVAPPQGMPAGSEPTDACGATTPDGGRRVRAVGNETGRLRPVPAVSGGARMATHARSLPEDVAVVRKFDRLCGSFDDPDELMGYRKLPDHSAPEPAQNAPGRPRTNDRPPVGGAGQGKVE